MWSPVDRRLPGRKGLLGYLVALLDSFLRLFFLADAIDLGILVKALLRGLPVPESFLGNLGPHLWKHP